MQKPNPDASARTGYGANPLDRLANSVPDKHRKPLALRHAVDHRKPLGHALGDAEPDPDPH